MEGRAKNVNAGVERFLVSRLRAKGVPAEHAGNIAKSKLAAAVEAMTSAVAKHKAAGRIGEAAYDHAFTDLAEWAEQNL